MFRIILFKCLPKKKVCDDLFCSVQFSSVLSYFPLFQYHECNAECDDKLEWKLHAFVFYMGPLLSFRTVSALNWNTR